MSETRTINQLPKEAGIFVIPLDVRKLSREHDTKHIISWIDTIDSMIGPTEGVGGVFVYMDINLAKGSEVSEKILAYYSRVIPEHKRSLVKAISNHPIYTLPATEFITWSQVLLNNEIQLGDFKSLPGIEGEGSDIAPEALLYYGLLKGGVKVHSNFVRGQEKWVAIGSDQGEPEGLEELMKVNPLKFEGLPHEFSGGWFDLGEKTYKLFN